MKISMDEFRKSVFSLCEYNYSCEAEDFLYNHEFLWNDEEVDEDVALDEIKEALDSKTPEECLEVIGKYIDVDTCCHVIISILKAQTWMLNEEME